MATTSSQPESEQAPGRETQSGLDENVAATLAYVLGWLTGIVMYLVESDNDTVRFHAAQSIVVFGGLSVASLVISVIQVVLSGVVSSLPGGDLVAGLLSLVVGLVSFAIWIGGFVLWAYLLVRTYQGNDPRIPVAAGFADDFA